MLSRRGVGTAVFGGMIAASLTDLFYSPPPPPPPWGAGGGGGGGGGPEGSAGRPSSTRL